MRVLESKRKVETLSNRLYPFENDHEVDAAVVCIGNPELWSYNISYSKEKLSAFKIDHYNFTGQSTSEDQLELVAKVDLASIGLHHSNRIILIGDGQGQYQNLLKKFTDLSEKYLLEKKRQITIQSVIQIIQKNEINYYDRLMKNLDVISLDKNIDEIRPEAVFVCCIDPRFIKQTIKHMKEIEKKNNVTNSILLTYPGSILCGLKDKSHYLNRYIKELVEEYNINKLFFINHESCGGYQEITKLHGWLQVIQQKKDLKEMQQFYLQNLLPNRKSLEIEKIQMKIDSLDKKTQQGYVYFETIK